MRPEKQKNWRTFQRCQSRRLWSEILRYLQRRSGLSNQSKQVEILLQSSPYGCIPVARQSRAKQADRLRLLPFCRHFLGKNFIGSAESDRQMRFGVEFAFGGSELLLRESSRLVGIDCRLVPLLGRGRGAGCP